MRKRNLYVLDLFCGAGGFSLGFEAAGFQVIAGIDNDRDALLTFSSNHPNAVQVDRDLSIDHELPSESLRVVDRKVDVIIGGPPCQGFSLSGPRVSHDPRNRLFWSFFRFVEYYRPTAFVLENVPGLGSLYGGRVKETILREFAALGYSVSASILNSAAFGVPQSRRRLFFVGLFGSDRFQFPQPTHHSPEYLSLFAGENYVTARDALDDLPMPSENESFIPYGNSPRNSFQRKMREGCAGVNNHVLTKHAKHVTTTIALVPEGGNYKDLPKDFKSTRNFNIAWSRIDGNAPAPTVDTGHRHHFHYSANRVPTVRENARLQSFPDRVRFAGTKTSQYRQVGNAVPPLLAEVIGREVKKYL